MSVEQEPEKNHTGRGTTEEQEDDWPSDQVTRSSGSLLGLRAVTSSFRGGEQSRIEPSRTEQNLLPCSSFSMVLLQVLTPELLTCCSSRSASSSEAEVGGGVTWMD